MMYFGSLILFSEDILLDLDYICKKIENKHKVKYDLFRILSRFLYTRLLYPSSKLLLLEESKRFLEQPEEDIHQVYRALSLLATEFNEIQSDVYKHSLKRALCIMSLRATTSSHKRKRTGLYGMATARRGVLFP